MNRKRLIHGSVLLISALFGAAAVGWSSSTGRPERSLAGGAAGPAAPSRDLARARNTSAYGISGIVSLAVAAGESAVQGGLAGVSLIGLPGDPITDTSGAYAATVEHGWSGNVTPAKAGYSFSPAYRIYEKVTAVQANQDYIATANRTISGSIKTVGGLGIAGVTLTFSNGGGTATTNASGDYSKQVASGWSGTATPSKTGYSFLSPNRSYANVTTDQSEQNFTAASSSFTISGVVLLASPTENLTAQGGLAGVTLNGLPGNPATDSSGAYASLVDEGWSGNVTPAKAGYAFSPVKRDYVKVTASQVNQDYTATLKTYVISGSVTTSTGTGIGSVEIAFSNGGGTATTDANGAYTRAVSYGWSGTATPSKPGYTFAPASRSYTDVAAGQTGQDFSATAIVPAISGTVKASGGAGIEGAAVAFSDGGTVTTDVSGNYTKTVVLGWTGTVTPSKAGYTFAPASRSYTSVTTSQTGQDFTGTSVLPPQIALSRSTLNYGAQSGGAVTAPQSVIVGNSGGGTLNWTAAPQYSWITVAPGTGTGTGTLLIGVNPSGLSSGAYTGSVSVTASGATNSPRTIVVNLQVYNETSSPIGVVETPADGTSGIEGSVPVTGGGVDDIGVESVKIYRDPMDGEQGGPNGLFYIGDAVFVEGARPDVEQAYSTYPLNSRAGWGYMMLTNFLPNSGNGTFRIHAIAADKEGKTSLLGTKTISCDNAHATLPFGAIDVPSQGGTAAGSAYINFAWVLTPMPKMIPTDGSTITAWVDGLPVGRPSYGYYRVDIATLFPGYANANGAIGYIPIDTTKYPNGVHTIVWSATDSAGVNNGFGSRYFTIQNAGSPAAAGFGLDFEGVSLSSIRPAESVDGRMIGARVPSRPSRTEFNGVPVFDGPGRPKLSIEDLAGLPTDVRTPVYVRKGFNLEAMPEAVFPNPDGVVRVEIPIAGRVEVSVDPESISTEKKGRFLACQIVGDEWRPLPIGSTFDAERGILTWQPGPGFWGEYRIVLIDRDSDRKHDVRVIIIPRPTG